MNKKRETIRSKIWFEKPSDEDPFVAEKCYLRGYDVYGDLLGNISWVENIFLLFKGEPPSECQARLFESLATVLATPGLRDHSVRASMVGGVGGSGSAASLMAALSIGAGGLGGGREILLLVRCWETIGTDLSAWRREIVEPTREGRADVWPELEHALGFESSARKCALPVLQLLEYLTAIPQSPEQLTALSFLSNNRMELERVALAPYAMTNVIAAAFYDLGFSAEQSEMLYLILRLPGAAAHAIEQRENGFESYPFWKEGLELTDDPGDKRDEINEVHSPEGVQV